MNKEIPAALLADFYKISHRKLYDRDKGIIYATWTPRKSRIEGINEIIVFGLQGFIKKYLIDYFNENFFNRSKDEVINEYKRIIKYTLGEDKADTTHLEKLHDLGYLPIRIDALEEGTICPIKCPCVTIQNTHPDFLWITNFIETLFSMEVWKPMTSATIAKEYRNIMDKWAEKTCDNNIHVDFQGHDFSMRGMGGLDSAMTSGAGHLTSFKGTDTIPAICYLEKYYNANVEKEVVGTSIPATEHSIMEFNSYGKENDEYDAFKRIITEVHPKGIVSIVSDTWNLWHVLSDTVPRLKDKILSRNGKVVIRPDSGDPCDIICGYNTKTFFDDYRGIEKPCELKKQEDTEYFQQINKGVIELLWDIFGGTINSKGYKVLNEHIGCIYGDAITLERAEEICQRLESKGFASSNIVFGIGSYTYNMNSRDTFGFALKSTYAIKDGKEIFLFKNPITDDGEKKSQKGQVQVYKDENGKLTYSDGLNSKTPRYENWLLPLFENGELLRETSLNEIRNRIKGE